MNNKKISVVIPCYNSEKSVEIIVNDLVNVLEPSNYKYEVVLVNDHSKDHTWDVLSKVANNNKNVVAINFSKNFGQHNAIMAAFSQVTGDYIVGLDDDGEHDPKEIFSLIDKLDEGFDYVCASYEENRGSFRGFGTKVNNWMAQVLIDKPKDITLSSYYVMRRFVVDEIVRYESAYPYIAGLLLRTTQNLGTVRLNRRERMFGTTGYTLRKMLSLWINGFTAFSVKPLRITSIVGGVVAIGGLIGALVVLLKKIFVGNILLGYASMMVGITFFSGIIMMSLGMIGEYLGRIYICINRAPQYVIKDKIDHREDAE